MSDNIPDSYRLDKRLSHSSFPQPPDVRIKVWRYMDLAKFVWLFKEKRLFMSRLDKLADPYEGSLTAKTIEGIDLWLKQQGSTEGWALLSKAFREQQITTYVCCRHANEYESEAMWRLYCGHRNGIAIRTTYEQLVSAIETQYEVYVGFVKYIDYEHERFADANFFNPVMHKRLAFAHEREVRLVSIPRAFNKLAPEQIPISISIPWDSSEMVDRV